MQNNTTSSITPHVNDAIKRMTRMATALMKCVEDFRHDSGPPLRQRYASVGFGNACFLAARFPDSAAALFEELQGSGVTGLRPQVVECFRDFTTAGDWIADIGQRLLALDTAIGNSGSEAKRSDIDLTLLAVGAGLEVARELPLVLRDIVGQEDVLNYESHYLGSRLVCWRDNEWDALDTPFIEFLALFYPGSARELGVVVRVAREVIGFAQTLSDPWALPVWADTGWHAGRKLAAACPRVVHELVAELEPETLSCYLDLYRSCVLRTVGSDGYVQPVKATLRYFGNTPRDIYARAVCRGDQPRFLARAAFDFTLWMGFLSTQPIAVKIG